MPETGPNLAEALRRYWRYHEFRPKQENDIRSLLAAHDTCVVMTTGGGKSLCYQLPAVISGQSAVVVSFFFSSRRRHTRCSRDWSSDVCSSDLSCAHANCEAQLRTRCAIYDCRHPRSMVEEWQVPDGRLLELTTLVARSAARIRSGERRVGEEWRSRWSPDH